MTSPTTDGTSGSQPASLLAVGRVTRAHGLTGEVAVELWTDRSERLDVGMTLWTDAGPMHVTASRVHQGRYLVRFDGVADRTGAEALRGVELRAEPVHVEGAIWVHELVGAKVRTTTGRDLGAVVAVERNPASDLLVLEGDVLVPLRFVTSAEPGTGLTVDIPDGLVD